MDSRKNLIRSRKDSKITVESCNVVRAGFNCEEVSENVTENLGTRDALI